MRPSWGAKVGRVLEKHKMAKHFVWAAVDGRLQYRRNDETITARGPPGRDLRAAHQRAGRAALAADTVRTYKGCRTSSAGSARCRAPRSGSRPIHHREERRVRAHLFVCLLAGYLEWHLRRALAPLLFDDETLAEARRTRDPVAKAGPTPRARWKKARRRTDDGMPLHSLNTLLAELATRCRNTLPRGGRSRDAAAHAAYRAHRHPAPGQGADPDFPVPGTA